MSTSAAPFGLRPLYQQSGNISPMVTAIASGYASNIFLYSPVKLVDGLLELAAAGDRAIGCFLGVRFVDTIGRYVYSNKWPAAQVATQVEAWYTEDPTIVYEIQSSGSVARSDIGEQGDWSTNNTSSGNTTTGVSTVSLGATADSGNAGLRVIGITTGPDNDWGDAFTTVQVQISEHQNIADRAAY